MIFLGMSFIPGQIVEQAAYDYHAYQGDPVNFSEN